MKKPGYTDNQILLFSSKPKQARWFPSSAGSMGCAVRPYQWRTKYGGMDSSLTARMKQLEEEIRRLKKMYTEERLKSELIQ
jgi:putative transposase